MYNSTEEKKIQAGNQKHKTLEWVLLKLLILGVQHIWNEIWA